MKWGKLDEDDSSHNKTKFSKSKSKKTIKKMKDHDKIFQSKKKYDKRDKK